MTGSIDFISFLTCDSCTSFTTLHNYIYLHCIPYTTIFNIIFFYLIFVLCWPNKSLFTSSSSSYSYTKVPLQHYIYIMALSSSKLGALHCVGRNTMEKNMISSSFTTAIFAGETAFSTIFNVGNDWLTLLVQKLLQFQL